MIKKSQIAINLMTNMIAMSFSMLISIWMAPYLIKHLGLAEYGYIGILNNLIGFLTVLTYTLNSMAGRFLTVALHQGGAEDAAKYISSAFYSNVFFGVGLLILIAFLTHNLDLLIKIQPGSVLDVKTAFFMGGAAFILTSISIVFSTAAYSGNRLDVINGVNIFSNIVRVILLVIFFSLSGAALWKYALACLLQVFIQVILNFFSFRHFLPAIHFDIRLFDLRATIELLSAGFFNSVVMLGNVFITQIDLIVGNRYLSPEIVGMYAAALLIPNSIRSVAIALSSAFSPTTLLLYSSGDMQSLREYSNRVVKFCGLMIGWPAAIAGGLALPLLSLWLDRDYSSYKYLFVLMLAPLTINLGVSQLYNVQQALNRVKIPALAALTLGFTNVVLAVFFTSTLKMGILGVVLSGVLASTVRAFIFMPIYTAIITGQPIFSCYKGLILPFFLSLATCALGMATQNYIPITTLPSLFFSAALLTICYFALTAVFLSPQERGWVLQSIKSVARKIAGTRGGKLSTSA